MGGPMSPERQGDPRSPGVSSETVSDLPFELEAPLVPRLRAAADIEGKLVRALDALGPLAGRDVGFVDLPDGVLRDRLDAAGIPGTRLPLSDPLAIDLPDRSLDAVITLWTAFRGVATSDLDEADRVLRPGGRLLVVHDYGRDDVSGLRDPQSPEYRVWSRREGPFLATAGFKIRVVHCFWTFASIEEARSFLGDAFGERGEAVGAGLKRPRLSWNVAIYHRWQGGVAPEPDPALAAAAG